MGEGLINAGFGRHSWTNLAGGERDETGGDKHESDAEISVLTQAIHQARNRLLYVTGYTLHLAIRSGYTQPPLSLV